MKIFCLSQGKKVPSSRFRLAPIFGEKSDFEEEFEISHSFLSSYPPKTYLLRPFWILISFFDLCYRVWRSRSFDVCILQREIISTLSIGTGFLKKPLILDIDDAIWLNRSRKSFKRYIKNFNLAVCGNNFIAEYLSEFGLATEVIPTPVDIERFSPNPNKDVVLDYITIGWSGTASGFQYLYSIETCLKSILDNYKHVRLCITAEERPSFKFLDASRYDFIKWTQNNEVNTIRNFDIGLMPLHATEWERGKCSYKMLLYMSCGIPVLVTCFGMNKDVLDLGECGIGIRPGGTWAEALATLIEDKSLRNRMGSVGREIVVKNFSTEVAASKWRAILSAVAKYNRSS